jgi:Zn-dependent protease
LLLMLLGVVAILGLMGDARILALTLLLLTSVFLHELGHALVARRHGIQVVDIILGPLVCSARMTEIPERARVEASIAIAGPATNFLLALLALPLLLLLQAPAFGTVGLEYGMWFIWVNVILGAFAARMGWLAATERAVQVGRVVAIALAIAGLFFFPRALLLVPLLAIYLWIMGTRELWVVRQRHGRSPLTGEPLPQGFGPFAGAFNAAGGFGTPFGGFGGFTARPTADGASEYTEAPHGADVEPTPAPSAGGARRPRTIDVEALSDETRSGGISDDAVRKLESFRGRLRRPNQD